MPTVELRFTALPAHVRTARLVAVSLARRAGVQEQTLDEIRLAVGEAASRAVGRHQSSCPDEPVLVRLTDGSGAFVAEVRDVAGEHEIVPPHQLLAEDSESELALFDDGLPSGVELAVIGGLVEDVTIEHDATGSSVIMTWPADSPVRAAGNSSGVALGHTPPSA